MRDIGAYRLRKAREDFDITQEDLAVATGSSSKTISRAEKGEPVSLFIATQICEYFSKLYHRQIESDELGLSIQRKSRVNLKSSNDVLEEKEERVQTVHKPLPLFEMAYTSFTPDVLSVGGLTINLIVLARSRYSPQEMQCFYDPGYVPLTSDFERLKHTLIYDLEKRKANGETHLPYNSETYKLKEFDVGYREIINGNEVPILRLKFGPTDYFTQMVTDLNIGNPLRERYAKAASITENPVPQFASILGVNLNVITTDGYLILTERSSQAFVAGGRLHTSVGENLLRPTDAGQSKAPDPFLCAMRGANEELGIPLNYKDIIFSTFTVIPDLCQYSLISTIQIPQTRTEVERSWRFAIPSDKWENRQLVFCPHTPDAFARLAVSTWDRWFNVALGSAILSLLDAGYSAQQVDTAFSHARSEFSI